MNYLLTRQAKDEPARCGRNVKKISKQWCKSNRPHTQTEYSAQH